MYSEYLLLRRLYGVNGSDGGQSFGVNMPLIRVIAMRRSCAPTSARANALTALFPPVGGRPPSSLRSRKTFSNLRAVSALPAAIVVEWR